ncbi:SPOR domain-containing protein [Luteimonas pelagia]
MLSRALLVLLVILNLGVAAWWIARPVPSPGAGPVQPDGVARLRLASEVPADARPPPPPEPVLCLRVGPYTADMDIAASRARLAEVASAVRETVERGEAPTRWRVMLPPDAGAAPEDRIARLASAGFDDVQPVQTGEEAGSIALGLFSGEVAARAHRDRIQASGFPAQLHADGGETRWLLVAFDAAQAVDVDASALRARASALRAVEVPCGPTGGGRSAP